MSTLSLKETIILNIKEAFPSGLYFSVKNHAEARLNDSLEPQLIRKDLENCTNQAKGAEWLFPIVAIIPGVLIDLSLEGNLGALTIIGTMLYLSGKQGLSFYLHNRIEDIAEM